LTDATSRSRLLDENTREWLRKRLSKRYRRLRGKFARRLAHHLPTVSQKLHAARYRAIERRIVGLPDRPRPILPDFIIIGAPKCGTSWLRDVLDQHPEVISVRGEIEYFSSHSFYPVEWYSEQFARRLASVKKVRSMTSCALGEKSAHYCSLPLEQIKRIRDLLPDVRLILMTRDPVERHWAHTKRYFSKRQLSDPETVVLRLPRSTLLKFFEHQRPVGEFSKIIANWRSVFPAEQLLVVSQEKTLEAPEASYKAVLKHIGVSTDYDAADISMLMEKKNQGPKVDMPDDIAEILKSLFAAERQWLWEFFDGRSFAYSPRLPVDTPLE